MSSLSIEQLFDKTAPQLNIVSKADIVTTLVRDKYKFTSAILEKKEAIDSKVLALKDSKLCKELIISFLNKEVTRNEWSKEIEGLDQMSLVGLVGELLGNVDKVRK
tara:strand:- start:2107 stop:2424 length:318 start_codon:yes stop_codon:yes gene_type:complete